MAKVRLEDVAVEARETWNQDRKDVPVVGLEHLEPDEIWLRQWNVNPDENTFTKRFKKGQLLFGRRRAYQKKMSLALCDGICSGDITVIAARPEKIVPELLPFYLRTGAFFDFAMRGSGGSLSPRVKWSHISDYEFDLPPIDEQKKLAELLWAANDLKESYKKAITATDEMLKAKFREMFGECGGQGDDCGFDDSRRDAESRSKWPMIELKSICSKITDGTHKTPKYLESGIMFLSAKDIQSGHLDFSSVKYISETEYHEIQKRCMIEPGDVLISKSGSLGASAIVPADAPRFGIFESIAVIKYNREKLIGKYLDVCIKSDFVQRQFEVASKGETIKHLHLNVLSGIQIPLPPLSLQRKFVAIADKAESAKANLKKSIAAIDQVMKGLINQ